MAPCKYEVKGEGSHAVAKRDSARYVILQFAMGRRLPEDKYNEVSVGADGDTEMKEDGSGSGSGNGSYPPGQAGSDARAGKGSKRPAEGPPRS